MSRPLVWRSGIVHRLIRQMAPASYDSTIRKMWQPTRICPYTLKLFRPARSSPPTLMHFRAVASGGSREVRCQFDTSEENCLPRRRRVFGRQLVAEPGQSNWLRSQLESTFGVSSLDRRKIQDPPGRDTIPAQFQIHLIGWRARVHRADSLIGSRTLIWHPGRIYFALRILVLISIVAS